MTNYEQIIATYPELEDTELFMQFVSLRNDTDGVGDYVEAWTYDKPLPAGLVVGKPE